MKRSAAASVGDSSGGKGAKSQRKDHLCDPKRSRVLKDGEVGAGPVLYWMSRDQRVEDNWALIYALEKSTPDQPAAVVFNLVDAFLGAGARQFVFMLRGLREVQARCDDLGIPFFFVKGDPADTIPRLVADTQAGLLVTDYSPLRLGRQWKDAVSAAVECPVHEVDAHNVVPVWISSDKREYAARTLRPKIHKKLPEYLKDYPDLPEAHPWVAHRKPDAVDWEAEIAEAEKRGAAVPPVKWCTPGPAAGREALSAFLAKKRLTAYKERNNPNNESGVSGLSPWLHFGHLSVQRAAVEATRVKSTAAEAADSFLEELVIRNALSDNFCEYEPKYDSLEAASDWAKDSLRKHASDTREHVYSYQQLEDAQTHDDLWNAAQQQMVYEGKMHGFLRMYWAKKILEWTTSPEEALDFAMRLNDKWELDGRDPNGYVGCMWSIAGIHDQGWAEREVFGKIRYMNYNGCKRKFKVKEFVERIDKLVKEVKAGK